MATSDNSWIIVNSKDIETTLHNGFPQKTATSSDSLPSFTTYKKGKAASDKTLELHINASIGFIDVKNVHPN